MHTSLLRIVICTILFVAVAHHRASAASSDAVGIRIFQNPQNLSAAAWYADRCAKKLFPTCGTPSPIVVDGYNGVRDGNSVYVNAANVTAGGIYTNIYLIALAKDAGSGGQAIFQQFLQETLRFNTNVHRSEDRAALRRDVRRREQVRFLEAAVARAKAARGIVPQLASGSYIRGISLSTWPSWQATLGVALGGALPTDAGKPAPTPQDPTAVLRLVGCVGKYDPATCWDAKASRMACPFRAYVFGYRAIGPTEAVIATTYEYAGQHNWLSENAKMKEVLRDVCTPLAFSETTDTDNDTFLDHRDNCPATANADQKDSDGDGMGDVCDVSLLGVSCPFDAANDSDGDRICGDRDNCPSNANPDQKDSDKDGVGDVCDTTARCGDGMVQKPNTQGINEECDDGAQNVDAPFVAYGKSVTHCTRAFKQKTTVGPFCKDKEKNGPEQCDPTDQKRIGVIANASCKDDCTGWSCATGFHKEGEQQCVANACVPDPDTTKRSCGPEQSDKKGVQTRTCNTNVWPSPWNPWLTCAGWTCNKGFHPEGNTCVANACVGAATESCGPDNSDKKGSRSHTCDTSIWPSTWSKFSACAGWTCGTGFHKEGEQCVANACVGAATESCGPDNSDKKGSRSHTCDTNKWPSTWSDFSACTEWHCIKGFHAEGGQCVQNICPETSSNCGPESSDKKGVQMRTCDATVWPVKVSDWSLCVGWTCATGFRKEGERCLSSERSCRGGNIVKGKELWDAVKQAFGECIAEKCVGGWREWEGQCERDGCDGSDKQDCTGNIENAASAIQERSCDASPNTHPPIWGSFGACVLQTCKGGYYQEGGACQPIMLVGGVFSHRDRGYTRPTTYLYNTTGTKIDLGDTVNVHLSPGWNQIRFEKVVGTVGAKFDFTIPLQMNDSLDAKKNLRTASTLFTNTEWMGWGSPIADRWQYAVCGSGRFGKHIYKYISQFGGCSFTGWDMRGASYYYSPWFKVP